MLTGLFETMSDGSFPVSAITHLSDEVRREGRSSIRVMRCGDAKPVSLLRHEWERLLAFPVQLIPAEPGTSIITADREGVYRTPLAGWALCVDGEVRPATPHGVMNDRGDGDGHYVEFSGGAIEAVGDWTVPCWFPDADAMLAYFQRPREGDGKAGQ